MHGHTTTTIITTPTNYQINKQQTKRKTTTHSRELCLAIAAHTQRTVALNVVMRQRAENNDLDLRVLGEIQLQVDFGACVGVYVCECVCVCVCVRERESE